MDVDVARRALERAAEQHEVEVVHASLLRHAQVLARRALHVLLEAQYAQHLGAHEQAEAVRGHERVDVAHCDGGERDASVGEEARCGHHLVGGVLVEARAYERAGQVDRRGHDAQPDEAHQVHARLDDVLHAVYFEHHELVLELVHPLFLLLHLLEILS